MMANMEIDDDDAPHGATVDLLYPLMHSLLSLVFKYRERYELNGLH